MQVDLIWMRSEALWLGPVAGLAAAPSETTRIYLPLDGMLHVDDGSGRLRVEPGGALIASGATAHRVEGSATRAACFFLDRAVYEPGFLEGRLASPAGRSWIRAWLDNYGEPTARLRNRPDQWAELFGPIALPRTHDAVSARLERGLRILRREPAADLGLERASAAAGWSRSRFRHVVRQRTGLSLKRYRLWAKLARAVALTRQGLNLTEAALDAGFSSSSHLSAAHAAMFGMTPSGAQRHIRGLTPGVRPQVWSGSAPWRGAPVLGSPNDHQPLISAEAA